MRSLEKLGFRPDKAYERLTVALDGTEVPLPADYLNFLSYEPPEDFEFGFRFTRSDTREEWEGQVVEFIRYDRATLADEVVTHPKNRKV